MTPRERAAPDASRRSERSRTAILDATRELIPALGYDNMSIEAIAARAGVGKQTIYRWWPSKGAVVLDMIAPDIHPRIGFPDTGDLAADLRTQLKTVFELGDDPVFGPTLRALIADSQHDPGLAQQLRDRIFGPRIAACKERLHAGQAAGQLAADADLDVAIDLFYGGFYHRYLLGVAPLTPAYADAVVEAAMTGVGGEPQTKPQTKPRSRPPSKTRTRKRPQASARG
jgi:AcrR family transcriptional regulator